MHCIVIWLNLFIARPSNKTCYNCLKNPATRSLSSSQPIFFRLFPRESRKPEFLTNKDFLSITFRSKFHKIFQMHTPHTRSRYDNTAFHISHGLVLIISTSITSVLRLLVSTYWMGEDRQAMRCTFGIFYKTDAHVTPPSSVECDWKSLRGRQHGNRCSTSMATRMFLCFANNITYFLHSDNCVSVDSTNFQTTSRPMPSLCSSVARRLTFNK